MLRQMWKKRVCFVLAVILAVIAVTPMEMEHTDAAMVHSVTALDLFTRFPVINAVKIGRAHV